MSSARDLVSYLTTVRERSNVDLEWALDTALRYARAAQHESRALLIDNEALRRELRNEQAGQQMLEFRRFR